MTFLRSLSNAFRSSNRQQGYLKLSSDPDRTQNTYHCFFETGFKRSTINRPVDHAFAIPKISGSTVESEKSLQDFTFPNCPLIQIRFCLRARTITLHDLIACIRFSSRGRVLLLQFTKTVYGDRITRDLGLIFSDLLQDVLSTGRLTRFCNDPFCREILYLGWYSTVYEVGAEVKVRGKSCFGIDGRDRLLLDWSPTWSSTEGKLWWDPFTHKRSEEWPEYPLDGFEARRLASAEH